MKIEKWQIIGGIIVAVLTLIGVIFGIIWPKEIKLEIIIKDSNTEKVIPGVIYINKDVNPINVNPATGTTVFLRQGKYTIRTASDGYHQKTVEIDRVSTPLVITMEPIAVITGGPIPFSFIGWRKWNEITLSEGANTNEIIINGTVRDAAGFNSTTLSTDLRGKVLILYFSNTDASRFSQRRLVKLEYNIDEILLRPTNASLLYDGYLQAEDTPLNRGIEFIIPNDFDGKLNFIFYQANLNDLKITAYYR